MTEYGEIRVFVGSNEYVCSLAGTPRSHEFSTEDQAIAYLMTVVDDLQIEDIDGVLYLRASEVAAVLGFKESWHQVKTYVFPEYKKKVTQGIGSPVWFLNEYGVRQLVLRSKLSQFDILKRHIIQGFTSPAETPLEQMEEVA